MFERNEKAQSSGSGTAPHRRLRQYLLSGVAAVALIAAVPAIYHANADAPLLQKNEAAGTLTLDRKAIGLPDFTQLVQRVKPAVVSVRVKEQASAQAMPDDSSDDAFKGMPFDKFFRDFPGRQGGQWKQQVPSAPVEAQGSGFFISADGYIVTNNHVVDGDPPSRLARTADKR